MAKDKEKKQAKERQKIFKDWHKDLIFEAEKCEMLAVAEPFQPIKRNTRKDLLKFARQCRKEAGWIAKYV